MTALQESVAVSSLFFMSAVSTRRGIIRACLCEEFGTSGYAPPLSSLESIDELVFTFEQNHSGSDGVVYLDNIRFER